MTENKGTQNDGLASSSSEPFDPLKFLANLVNFEDTNIVFSDDEIRKIAVEEERFDEVKNLLADLTKTPATNDDDRITQFPTKELEAYYKSCPHPNEQQRRELAKELGLIHLQVLFWFKNKRKQMKNHRARMENYQLRAENKNLKNMKLKENVCLCGKHDVMRLPEEHELRMENKRLKKEYKKLLSKVGNFGLE